LHYFELLNIRHFVLYLFPALVFVVIFAAALAYTHVRAQDSEERRNKVIERYPGGIEGRNAPFPLALILIIVGTVLWAFFYILLTGLLGVKI
jgi:CDP-diacylglycerol pyrophosphatase